MNDQQQSEPKKSRRKLYIGLAVTVAALAWLPFLVSSYYPAPQALLEQMWAVRGDVWKAMAQGDDAQAAVHLTQWRKLIDKAPWTMRLYGETLDPDTRRRLEVLKVSVDELEMALQSGKPEDKKTSASRCLDAYNQYSSAINKTLLASATAQAGSPGQAAASDLHKHGQFAFPSDRPPPTIKATVHKDPKAGWNLHVQTTNFRFTPERAGRDHVLGEGHCHLYIDGKKITRLYGEWFLINELTPGTHEIRVTMSCNNHDEYTVNGKPVEDTVQVEVGGRREDIYFNAAQL